MQIRNTVLIRYFTVVCIKESCLLSINVANLHKMSKLYSPEFKSLFKNSQTSLSRALKQKFMLTQNITNKKMMVSAKQYYKINYEKQFDQLDKDLELDDIQCRYFKGAKTMKFINNKNVGAIKRDFSIEKSFESFCTDESMKSWEEGDAKQKSKPKLVQPVTEEKKSLKSSFM